MRPPVVRGGFQIFGIESVSHRVRVIRDGSLVSISWVPITLPLEEFYFADGLIFRGEHHPGRRPASAPGCHVATAHPAAITGWRHQQPLLAL